MSGRSRRVVQKKGAAEVAAALAQLNAAKAGSKRLDTFELKEETAVYDVVDDEQYAQLVTKRRIEAGDFIEEDDGEYGADLGEEDDFFNGDGDRALSGKKRKDGGGKDASAAKRQAAEEAAKARKNKERLHAMFAKAAAQSSGPKANDKEADDLLEDILGDLGGEPAKPAAAAAGGNPFARAKPAVPAAAGRAPAGAAAAGGSGGVAMKTFVRGGASGGARGGAGSGGRPSAPAAAAAGGLAGRKRPLLNQQPAQSLSFGGAALAGQEEEEQQPVEDDGPAGFADEDGDVAMKQEEPAEQDFSFAPPGQPSELSGDPFQAPAAGAAIKQEQLDTPSTAAAAAAGASPAAAAAAGAGAGPKRFSDDTPAGPDVAACPATGWAEVYGGDVEDEAAAANAAAAVGADGSSSPAAGAAAAEGAAAGGAEGLAAQADGAVPFFFMDAYEAPERPDVLYLFGKVSATNSGSGSGANGGGSSWQSCCVVVPNLHRSLLVVPRPSVFEDSDGEIAALEAAVAADPARKIELLQLLHARCTDLKAELRALMLRHGIKSMRLVPVKRNYAFEDASIPAREQWVIKVRYSASLPTLPMGLSGSHFVAIAATNQSSLEALLLKRGLRGPGWCLLTGATRKEGSAQVSWCKVELELPNAKGVRPAEPGSQLAAKASPPLTVAALNLRLHMDPKTQQQEILAASVVHMSGVSPDAPTPRAVWSRPDALRNFSIVRKLDGRPWPTGFEALVASENASPRGRLNGGAMLSTSPNERALLSCLLAKLAALDADVLVGHNIGAYELAVLMGRLQSHKVQLWSRLGRLKRSSFPKMAGGGHTFGGGAAPGLMSVLAGRLLCDTYLSARELVREVDYTLKTLAKNLLGQDRSEVPSTEVPGRYENAAGLRQLLLCGESDAWLALGLAMQLSVLPLTKQLSVVSGSLWSKTLQGARAQRIEMLLLHEFHARKFILPDKLTARDKAAQVAAQSAKAAKGKGAGKGKKGIKAEPGAAGGADAEEEYDGPAPPEDEEEEAAAPAAAPTAGLSKKAGGKGPQYAGGLVLEPKKGLYDKFVIMLDFNSLYPSIIQEYNICFTTVKRPTDGSMPALPTAANGAGAGALAPLPTVIQGLVRKRREVKAQMKTCRDPVLLQQLQIRQQALKLTANSMYGCLGFSNSRFFARPLAELITSQGRDILQSTVDLVNDMGVPGLEVIYGDTDSIMIYTNSTDYDAAEALGAKVKAAVNRRYRLLEIELDAVYRCMLLLKKKKYAAVKVEKPLPGGGPGLVEVLEAKGLDMVRRDWSTLSKDTGNYVLQQILSGQPKADVVEAVHEKLRSVAAALSAGELPLSAFVITKQLTKRPEDYPDAKGQPHVQVALRRRAAGKRDGVMAGETVPYIICIRLSNAAAAAVADGSSTDAAAGTPQQQQQQQPEAAASPQQQQDISAGEGAAAASPAAAAAAGGSSGGGVRAMTVAAAASRGGSAAGGIAERAFHPDELRTDPNLVIDAEYYLAQQVLPVVMRLCAPIEGTNASHLAQCLGLDASRYGHSGSSSNNSMAALLREEALQVTGSLLDDDTHYSRCDPLTLTSSNGTSWDFRGVRAAIKSGEPGSCLLTPPDAVGDAAAELSPAQLANQAMLAARKAIVRYYDGVLVSDDEVSGAAGTLRDVVLAPAAADAPPGTMPMAATAAAAAAGRQAAAGGGSGSGLLLSRAYGESQLYTQLCHIVRLLDVKAALETMPDQSKRNAAQQQLAGGGGGNALLAALNHAAGLVARLRDSSGYRWVNLSAVFARMRTGRKAAAAGGPRAATAGGGGIRA